MERVAFAPCIYYVTLAPRSQERSGTQSGTHSQKPLGAGVWRQMFANGSTADLGLGRDRADRVTLQIEGAIVGGGQRGGGWVSGGGVLRLEIEAAVLAAPTLAIALSPLADRVVAVAGRAGGGSHGGGAGGYASTMAP